MEPVGRWTNRWWVVLSVFATGTFAACSGGSTGSRTPGINAAGSTSGTGNPDSGAAPTGGGSALWADLPIAEIALIGGAASSAGGIAQAGGTARLISSGGIALNSSLPAPQPPAVPPPAAGAMLVSGSPLAADITAPAGLAISEMVQSSGTDTIRHIKAGGDVVISGTLRAADLGASRQGLDIEAVGHTVYISGTVDSSGAKGQAGGPVTIVADQVVVTGKVSTAGGAGAQPGAAGAVTIKTTSAVWVAGALDASGGDASGSDGVTGGRGGDLMIAAGGDIALAGTLRVRGGAGASSAGNAQGGAAGALKIDCSGTLTWQGTLDARGGVATAKTGGGAVAGGAAGTLTVGATTPPKAINVVVPVAITGGPGTAVGGDGGSAELDAKGGDLVISSFLDVSGGDSPAKPGKGGTIQAYPGPNSAAANLDISGQVLAKGGSVPPNSSNGAAADGGAGGLIKLLQQSTTGNTTTEPTADIRADGGQSGGAGTAGPGGLIYVFTKQGNATVHGQVNARGGDAPDSGGTGGGGGFVYVFTGDGHDRMSGILIIAPDGVVDASGGNGTVGGSARNNGGPGVADWPSPQDDEFDVEQTAVLINSDGVHGADRGWLDNQGKVIARGGKPNGSGGDVQYHGRQQDGNETPAAGDVENAGDGSGKKGDFAGE